MPRFNHLRDSSQRRLKSLISSLIHSISSRRILKSNIKKTPSLLKHNSKMMRRYSSIRKEALLNLTSQSKANQQRRPLKLLEIIRCSNTLNQLSQSSNRSKSSHSLPSPQVLKTKNLSSSTSRLARPSNSPSLLKNKLAKPSNSPSLLKKRLLKGRISKLNCKNANQSSTNLTIGSQGIITGKASIIITMNTVSTSINTSTLKTDIITICSTLTIPCLTQTMMILTSSLVSTTTKILNITHHTT